MWERPHSTFSEFPNIEAIVGLQRDGVNIHGVDTTIRFRVVVVVVDVTDYLCFAENRANFALPSHEPVRSLA